MKKIILICISLLILFILPGCEEGSTEDLTLEIEKLKEENELLKTELEEVTKERDALMEEKEYTEDGSTEKEVEAEELVVEVINKVNISKSTSDRLFNDRVNFHIKITNNFKKDIQEIQGVLDIKDSYGVGIIRFKANLKGEPIETGSTVINKDTMLSINEYISEDLKVYRTDHEDLDYTYKINKIIFTDGTSK